MAAYVIYQGEVLDPVRYEEYKMRAAASLEAAGGRYVVRGGDYTAARAIREGVARARMYVVDGVER